MFRKNHKHKEPGLFGFQNLIKQSMYREIMETEEYKFYELIFCRIREEDFSCLYSEVDSRPNAPVNSMVASLLLQHRNNWTFSELRKNIKFNLLTKTALGLGNLDEVPYSEATLFNFIKRLSEHERLTGVNLLEKVFDQLTDAQLKELKVRTNIQRTDSFQAASNIRKYSRLQFLVEILQRVHRELSQEDRLRHGDIFSEYVKETSGEYVYHLKPEEMPDKLSGMVSIFKRVKEEVLPVVRDKDITRIFNRVYSEHFIVDSEGVKLREEGWKSSFLLSPDDEDATFRKKRNTEHRGYVVNLVETCNPENEINLLTDVAVCPNNVDDSRILSQRIDNLKEKTPDLEELHGDGGYPSATSDKQLEAHGVRIIQTAIRRKPIKWIQPEIDKGEDGVYTVSCPLQKAEAKKSNKRYVAEFAGDICESCPFSSQCKIQKGKGVRRYYFKETKYLMQKRHRAIDELPESRRTLRSNVEATVAEFSRKLVKGKLRQRGRFRASVFAYCSAIVINFGRIFRYLRRVCPEMATS
jgi:hypothetical protein